MTITDETTTAVARIEPTPTALTLRASLDYSRALAASNMLPAQYRNRPENVLWAMEYGRTIGLTPMAAITGVHVIEGKPTASAGLISGLVRKAGHKLRIKGDATSATATIIRSDDPGHPFEVTFTIDDARAAGLLSKNVWKQYPASMLKARAITQCARDACEEVLFGLHYTPEELGAEVDEEGVAVVHIEPPREAPDPAVARSIAVLAAACDDIDKIRDTWKEAKRRGLLDMDVWDAVGHQAGSLDISMGDLDLGEWLQACAKRVAETGVSVDAELQAAMADDGEVDEGDVEAPTVDRTQEPAGWELPADAEEIPA